MTRLIDADALKEPLTDEYKKLNDAFNETSVFKAPNDVALYGALMQEVGAIIGAIDEALTVDAVSVVHGRWDKGTDSDWHICEECGAEVDISMGTGVWVEGVELHELKYCPACGARMDDNG